MRYDRTINHPLKRLIFEKGYSIHDFAYLCDIDHSTIYGMLRGKTKMPQMLTIKLMAEVLETNIEEVMRCFDGT